MRIVSTLLFFFVFLSSSCSDPLPGLFRVGDKFPPDGVVLKRDYLAETTFEYKGVTVTVLYGHQRYNVRDGKESPIEEMSISCKAYWTWPLHLEVENGTIRTIYARI